VVFAGLVLAIAAVFLSASRTGKVKGKGGAVVIIGPFPIILGSDWRSARQLLLLAIILVVTLLVLYLIQIL
jgi:uncharacterized protein (TIGR00304 family)